jgi:hypothetical protein
MLGFPHVGPPPCWASPMLGLPHVGPPPCWASPMLGCWASPMLGLPHVGDPPCWASPMLGLPLLGLPRPNRFDSAPSEANATATAFAARNATVGMVVLGASSMPPARLLYVAAPAHFPLKQHSSHELQRPNSLRSTRRNADSQNCYGLVLAGPVPCWASAVLGQCRALRLWPQPCAACSFGTPGPNTHARTHAPCPHALRCAAHALRQASTGLSGYVACWMFACCVLHVAGFMLRVGCSHLGGTGPSSARSPTATAAGTRWYWQYSRGGTGSTHAVVLAVLTRWYCRRYSAALSAVVNSMLQLEPSARPDASQASACTQ